MSFRISDEEAKKQFTSKGVELSVKTIRVGGRNIHYASAGDESKPVIIFIHGTPGSWNAFMQYLQDKELLERFRLVSVDRPGFGYSDFGMPLNLAQQSEILNEWIRLISPAGKAWLAGHSLGGPLVIKMAADDPQLFRGLVIISGSIDPAAEKAEKWRVVLFKTPLNYFLPGAFRPSNKELWYLKNDLKDLTRDFAKVQLPVYFIHGEKDSWVPVSNVDYGRKMFKNSPEIGELIIPTGHHFIPWTHYKEIKKVLLDLP